MQGGSCVSRRSEKGITRLGWCAGSCSLGKLTFLEIRDPWFFVVSQDLCNLGIEILLESLQLFPLIVRELQRIPVERGEVLARGSLA